ncbi:MAG: sugar phosphate isomerase/epimerase family protein [Planctomycetota bacterium]|jgi:sugar phosphate isomerase/epimerase
MYPDRKLTRRRFVRTAALGSAATAFAGSIGYPASADAAVDRRIPLKIGIRAASMQMVGDFDVIKTAAGIPGVMGVELQTTSGTPNLRDWDAVRRYKQETHRWGMHVPSLAGVWDRGVRIGSPSAGKSLIQSIRAAELLGSRVILLAFFRENAPDMTDEESYGPIVTMLRETARCAAEAGVIMGLENSLSPAGNKKLVDLVDHPAVQVYYDPHNMAHYGHGDEAIPGIRLLGKQRICMVHVKNEKKLLEEPGLIDWAAAFRAFNEIEYDGWYIYETGHDGTDDCIEDTKKNNAFLQKHVHMPFV